MKATTLALIVIACGFSCASKPKPAPHATVAPPPLPPLRLKADGPVVAYVVPQGWRAMPPDAPAEPVILVHPGNGNQAVALLLQETALSDKLEEITTRWAMLAATMLNGFHVTGLEQPTYPSDGESSFIIQGVDDAKRPLFLQCRIKNVGAPTVDFWVIVLVSGTAADAKELTEMGDNLMKSLHVQVPEPPK